MVDINPYTRGYFEAGQGSNYHGYGDDPGWAPTADILRSVLPQRAPTLLELGSAKGYFLWAARRRGFEAIGVDMSLWAVSQTVNVVNPYNLLLDVTKQSLPFQRGLFDVVCSWEFLEHIHSENMGFVLRSALWVLRPGGRFIHRIALEDADMEDDDHTHVSVWPRSRWEQTFDDYGLEQDRALEDNLRNAFHGRDWSERFFCLRKPRTAG